jgi:hypothetical protein
VRSIEPCKFQGRNLQSGFTLIVPLRPCRRPARYLNLAAPLLPWPRSSSRVAPRPEVGFLSSCRDHRHRFRMDRRGQRRAAARGADECPQCRLTRLLELQIMSPIALGNGRDFRLQRIAGQIADGTTVTSQLENFGRKMTWLFKLINSSFSSPRPTSA